MNIFVQNNDTWYCLHFCIEDHRMLTSMLLAHVRMNTLFEQEPEALTYFLKI